MRYKVIREMPGRRISIWAASKRDARSEMCRMLEHLVIGEKIAVEAHAEEEEPT